MKKILLLILLPTLIFAQVSPTGFEAYEYPLPDFTPNAPQNLVATGGVGQVSLEWDIPLDIFGNSDTDIAIYNVQRKTGIGGAYTTIASPTTNSYSDVTAEYPNEYYYKVRAVDIGGNVGGYSSESNASPTQDITPPTAPGSFIATANGLSITLTWSASTDVGGSGVENYSGDRSLSADFSNPTSFTTTSLSFAHSNLAASTTYYYRIRAKDYSGNYSTYSTASATTAEPTSDPVISSATGTFSNGGILNIGGSGFGSRTVTQQIFDTVESGAFSSQWSQTGYPPGRIYVSSGSNTRHQYSTYYGESNFVGALLGGWAQMTGGSNDTQWFCQYWFKLDPDWTWGTGLEQNVTPYNLSNIKIMRLWSTGSSPEDIAIATEGWSNRIIITGENIPGQQSFVESGYQTSQYWSRGTWHCMQIEFKENSAVGVADGVFKWWLDGRQIYSSSSRVTRLNSSETKRPFGIGFYNTSGDQQTDDNHVYFDDFYMQNSIARVEIGEFPVYTNSTQTNHREIQPNILLWTSSQIQISLNKGSFTTGQTAYIFVINSNGVPSVGYPITIQ